MSKRNRILRGIALLLASIMILTSVPTDVLATESNEIIENEAEIEIESESETETEPEAESREEDDLIISEEASDEADVEATEETDTEDIEVFDYHSDELATVFEGSLTSEEIEQKSELHSSLASVIAATPDVDYVSDEVIMWSESREKAESAAKAFSKATGFLVYLDSYEAEIAVLKIKTCYAADLKKNGVPINSLVNENELSFDNPVITLMSIAADPQNNLPPVYQNGISTPDSVGNTVTVDVTNEVADDAHFNDPYLGKLGTSDATLPLIEESKYQWYHEIINDKFVWNEMDKLKDLGDEYKGPLNPNYLDNLSNITVAVIDTGLNDDHSEWKSTDRVSTESKSFVTYSFIDKLPESYADAVAKITCPETKPDSVISPMLDGMPASVIYPAENPWSQENPADPQSYYPEIPQKFSEDNPDNTFDAWKLLWNSGNEDKWHSAWKYMWDENYLYAYSTLWEKGNGSAKEGWQLAWGILIDENLHDNQDTYGWYSAYYYNNEKKFADANGYKDEYSNYGGSHGSNVASIIAEPADNNIAGRGVAAGAKVLALKLFGANEVRFSSPEEVTIYNNGYYAQLLKENGIDPDLVNDNVIDWFKNGDITLKSDGGSDSGLIRAINYARYHSHKYEDADGTRKIPGTNIIATDENVRVINMSLGGPVPNYLIEEAINLATDSNILVVASAGNDNSYHRQAPSDFDNVLNVASINADYQLSSFSNHGTGVDIAAPGGEMHPDENYPVEYTDNSGEKAYYYYYELYNWSSGAPYLADGEETPNMDTATSHHGTSQASPVAAGVAALAIAQYMDPAHPEYDEYYNSYWIRDLLINSAKPIKTQYSTVNKCVDAAAAVGLSTDLEDTYIDTYSAYDPEDMNNSITVDPSFMTLGSTIAMTYPSDSHAVFYFTANGKKPVINDDVPDIANDSAEPSKNGTYKSYNGIVTVKELIDKGLISGKGSFTFKYNVLLYGVQSKTYEIKMTFDTPVTSSIAIRPKDNRPALSFTFGEDPNTYKMDGIKLGVGNKLQLAVDFTPASAATKQIFWESSDTSLVTVTQTGLVTAKFLPGNTYDETTGAIITAKALDGSMDAAGKEITASYYIQVAPQIQEIKFTEMRTITLESYTVFKLWPYDTDGQNKKNLYVYPENASISMFYSSDNEKIVTVDSDGLIQYVSDGHTYITVTSADNPKVKTKIEVFADKLGQKDATRIDDIPDISAGQSVQLTYSKSFNNEKTKYEWYVAETEAGVNYYLNGENENSVDKTPNPADYFTLNAKSGKLTAKKNLPCAACFTIGLKEAGTNNREPKITKTINIYPATSKVVLNETEVTVVCAYSDFCELDISQFIKALEPTYQYDDNDPVSLTKNIVSIKSSNPSVLSPIPDAGLRMIVHKPGKATVTIMAEDGSKKSAKLNVTVLAAYAQTGAVYEMNDCYALTPSNKLDFKFVANSDTDNYPDKRVTYSLCSSVGDPDAEECVTIDANGIVKPVADKLKKFIPNLQKSGGDEKTAREMMVTVTRNLWVDIDNEYQAREISLYSYFYLYPTATKSIVTSLTKDCAVNTTKINISGIGSQQKLYVKSLPEGSYQDRYEYTSANKNVCSVLMDGTIIANGTGSTNVTVTAKDGSKVKAKVKVTVTQPVTEINIVSPTGEYVVGAGKSLKLKAEVNATASNKKVTWGLYSAIKPDPENEGENVVDFNSVITDKNIATMSNGTIKAGKIAEPMTVYAVAQSTDGSNLYGFVPVDLYPITASIKTYDLPVSDANKKEVKDITLSKFIIDGSELKAHAELYPFAYPLADVNAPTYNGNFAVKSSNTKVAVATVLFDPDTHRMQIVVTPVNKGKCKISVTALDGSNKSASVNVTVINPVTGISLSTKSGLRSVAAGKSLQMIASTNPDASNKKVNWEIVKLTDIETGLQTDVDTDPPTPVDIDNEDIPKYVSITSGGVVKAVKGNNVEMTATVRATAADGSGYSREMVIYLNKKVSRLFVYTKDSNEKEMNLLIGSKTQFLTTVNTDACNPTIKWCLNKTDIEDPNAFDPAANGIAVSAKGLLTIPKNEELLGKEFYVTAWAADKNKRAAQHDILIRIGDGSYITCNRGGSNEDVDEVTISYNMTSVLNFVVRNAKGEVIDKTISAGNISVIDEGKVLDEATTVCRDNSITVTSKASAESEGIVDPEKPVKITVCADPVKGPFKTVTVRIYGDGGLYQKINNNGQHDKIISVGYPTLPGYSNANGDVLRFCVWVETDYDTDGDGKKDLVKAFLQVPRFAAEKVNGDLSLVPTIYDPTPYNTGTVVGSPVSIRQPYNEKLDAEGEGRSRDVDTISVLECAAESPRESWYYKFPMNGKVMPEEDSGYASISNYDYFLERGYAICLCSGIGTYDSEGFELCGTTLERDAHKAVVEWLHGKEGRVAFTDKKGTKMVKADWSNGNIAMTGASYGGTLPYEVAVTGVEGLKTIIPIGGIADWYEYTNSQGVALRKDAYYTPYLAYYNCGRLFDRFDGNSAMMERYQNWLGDTEIKQVEANGDYKDVWSALNYSEYSDATKDNYHDGKLDINCSALIVSGLNDNNVLTKHADKMYRAFTNAGKEAVMILHQGGHCDLFNMNVYGKKYEEILDSWLIRYLYADTAENYGKAVDFLDSCFGELSSDGGSSRYYEYPVCAQKNNVDDEGKAESWIRLEEWENYSYNVKKFVSSDTIDITEFPNPTQQEKTITADNDYAEAMNEWCLSYGVGYEKIAEKLLEMARTPDNDNALLVDYDLRNSTIVGIPAVEVTIETNDIDNMALSSLIEDENHNPADGMMVSAYLVDELTSDEDHPEWPTQFGAYIPDVMGNGSSVKTGSYTNGIDVYNVYKRTNTTAKIISYGWTDLNNPGGGYYSNDDAYKNRQAWEKKNDKYESKYTIYMNPTCYEVEEGHKLSLVLMAWDPKTTYLDASYRLVEKDNNKYLLKNGGAEYSFTVSDYKALIPMRKE